VIDLFAWPNYDKRIAGTASSTASPSRARDHAALLQTVRTVYAQKKSGLHEIRQWRSCRHPAVELTPGA